MSTAPATRAGSVRPTPRRRLGPGARKLALTVHVAASVALLGTTAATLVLALRAALTEDGDLAHATYRLMETLSFALNIPLSFIALGSGVVVGVGTRWGVFRHWWVTAKLGLLLVVIAVGALVVGAGIGEALEAAPGSEPASVQWRIVAGAATALAALFSATTLSVYKPGGRWRRLAKTTQEERPDDRDHSCSPATSEDRRVDPAVARSTRRQSGRAQPIRKQEELP